MFREEMENIISQKKKLEQSVSALKDKLDEKDQVIKDLTDRLDRSEQYSRRNNIRIMGGSLNVMGKALMTLLLS